MRSLFLYSIESNIKDAERKYWEKNNEFARECVSRERTQLDANW